MKKNFLLLGAVLTALFISCSGGKSGSAGEGVSDANANEIIEYYNSSLNVLKNYASESHMTRILEYMGSKGKSFAPVIAGTFIYERDTAKLKSPGSCFDKEVRQQLSDKYAALLSVRAKFFENFETFKSYIKAEDYKDDNYAKATQLLDENKKLYEEINGLKTSIYDILSPIADAAEAVVLEDNPLKEHILAAKKMFTTMEVVLEEYAKDDVNKEEIEKQYTELEKQVAEARKISAVADHKSQMDAYARFLDEVDTFLGELRKSKRDGKFTESGFKSLNSEYESVISDYNSFVD